MNIPGTPTTVTIAVGKKDNGEEFAAEDLKLFHEECGGGVLVMERSSYSSSWLLKCKRCHMSVFVAISEKGTALLARTALDGERREVESSYDERRKVYATQRA